MGFFEEDSWWGASFDHDEGENPVSQDLDAKELTKEADEDGYFRT